jgi:hypothetical protein
MTNSVEIQRRKYLPQILSWEAGMGTKNNPNFKCYEQNWLHLLVSNFFIEVFVEKKNNPRTTCTKALYCISLKFAFVEKNNPSTKTLNCISLKLAYMFTKLS